MIDGAASTLCDSMDAFLDGELGTEQLARFADHVIDCPGCQERLRAFVGCTCPAEGVPF